MSYKMNVSDLRAAVKHYEGLYSDPTYRPLTKHDKRQFILWLAARAQLAAQEDLPNE